MNQNLTTVSIFSGAGGLDIGFEQAGFETISTLEIVPAYHKTLQENQRKQIPIPQNKRCYLEGTTNIQADIHTITADQLISNNDTVDCLIGGPPCQAFSSAGKQRSVFDHRGTLIYEYFRILNELQPKTFLFENVRGFVTARGVHDEPGEVLQELLQKFQNIGFHCRVALLNSADFGSYQRRMRCFIMGSRIGLAPCFPQSLYGKKSFGTEVKESLPPWRTLGQFLEKYADNDQASWILPTPALRLQLEKIPAGKGLISKGRVEATRPGGHWGYRQGTFIADPSKPARTVTGSSSQDWIRTENGILRRLSLKEIARLQGFPDSWTFCGSKREQYQQIGNAVPVVFGKVLGEAIAHYLRNPKMQNILGDETILPKEIRDSIRNTKQDSMRNGYYRVRSKG